MKYFKTIGTVLGIIATLFVIWWICALNGLFAFGFFAPKEEAIRRQTFEESKAYNQGTIQELQNMHFEYIKADSGHKDALASIILHRAADYDENKMPADLRNFISDLKQKQ